ncbi:hypothetical protein SESBI_11424 [Sesbania bispinosa]|nr:hypothetical protein SESBI_11424 [Sesbania bispinosa]
MRSGVGNLNIEMRRIDGPSIVGDELISTHDLCGVNVNGVSSREVDCTSNLCRRNLPISEASFRPSLAQTTQGRYHGLLPFDVGRTLLLDDHAGIP